MLVWLGIQQRVDVGKESHSDDMHAVIGLAGQYLAVYTYGIGVVFFVQLRCINIDKRVVPTIFRRKIGSSMWGRTYGEVSATEIAVEQLNRRGNGWVCIASYRGQNLTFATIGQCV